MSLQSGTTRATNPKRFARLWKALLLIPGTWAGLFVDTFPWRRKPTHLATPARRPTKKGMSCSGPYLNEAEAPRHFRTYPARVGWIARTVRSLNSKTTKHTIREPALASPLSLHFRAYIQSTARSTMLRARIADRLRRSVRRSNRLRPGPSSCGL